MIHNGATINGIHTYRDLLLIPCSKLLVAPPQPKLVLLDIIGADGAIDITGHLSDELPVDNAKGTWDFIVPSGLDYPTAYANVLAVANGRFAEMVLDDDPGTIYRGRFWVSKWKSFEKFSRLSIDYNIDPW